MGAGGRGAGGMGKGAGGMGKGAGEGEQGKGSRRHGEGAGEQEAWGRGQGSRRHGEGGRGRGAGGMGKEVGFGLAPPRSKLSEISCLKTKVRRSLDPDCLSDGGGGSISRRIPLFHCPT